MTFWPQEVAEELAEFLNSGACEKSPYNDFYDKVHFDGTTYFVPTGYEEYWKDGHVMKFMFGVRTE